LAHYRDLKDSARRRRAEVADRVFVVEGKLALGAVLASPYPLLSVLVLRRRLGALADLALVPGTPVYVVGDDVMGGIAGYNVHRGLLAVARRLPPPSVEDLLTTGPASPLVVVEGVNDQENLGAIFRNAAAFGAGAVLVDPTCADPLYRRCVRVSLGMVLKVPFARLTPWPESLELLKNNGFVALALTPDPGADRIEAVAAELCGTKVALVVGGEGHGLTPEVMQACRQARIAMADGVDSLNVAAATAVALHRFAVNAG
jgi:tRNA G18 (ribose-2'-O)-methylase SpoU